MVSSPIQSQSAPLSSSTQLLLHHTTSPFAYTHTLVAPSPFAYTHSLVAPFPIATALQPFPRQLTDFCAMVKSKNGASYLVS